MINLEQLEKIVLDTIKKIQGSELNMELLNELLSKQQKIDKAKLEEILRQFGENS